MKEILQIIQIFDANDGNSSQLQPESFMDMHLTLCSCCVEEVWIIGKILHVMVDLVEIWVKNSSGFEHWTLNASFTRQGVIGLSDKVGQLDSISGLLIDFVWSSWIWLLSSEMRIFWFMNADVEVVDSVIGGWQSDWKENVCS